MITIVLAEISKVVVLGLDGYIVAEKHGLLLFAHKRRTENQRVRKI